MMNLNRKLSAMAGLLLAGLCGSAGCSTYATQVEVPVDCTVESGYEFQTIDNFEMLGSSPPFWSAGDNPLVATIADTVQTIPGGRCGSTAAVVLSASHVNDWGGLFGFNNFGPRDASAYEGMSFWAKAPRNTTNAFTLALSDSNTSSDAAPVARTAPPADAGPTEVCTNYFVDGGTTNTTTTTTDPGTGSTSSGGGSAPTQPDACGNGYSVVQQVTSEWRFYKIPFADFQQDSKPNRVPNSYLYKTGPVAGTGLLTGNLKFLIVRAPREASMEMWLDNLSFYRKAGTGTKTDAGTSVSADAAPKDSSIQ